MERIGFDGRRADPHTDDYEPGGINGQPYSPCPERNYELPYEDYLDDLYEDRDERRAALIQDKHTQYEAKKNWEANKNRIAEEEEEAKRQERISAGRPSYHGILGEPTRPKKAYPPGCTQSPSARPRPQPGGKGWKDPSRPDLYDSDADGHAPAKEEEEEVQEQDKGGRKVSNVRSRAFLRVPGDSKETKSKSSPSISITGHNPNPNRPL